MGRYGVLSVLVVCSGLAVAGFDDSVNGTSQDWEFNSFTAPGRGILPDVDNNSEGTAIAVLDYGVTTGGHRVYSEVHQGVMFDRENLGISIEIPNYDIDNPYKEIYVEIIYWGVIGDASVTWEGMTGPEIKTQPDNFEDKALADGWREYSALWTIEPNPKVETIQYSFVPGTGQVEAQLDYISVRTACIPEPATLLLFALGGLVLRKKRQS